MKIINNCPVCESSKIDAFMNQNNVPVNQNLPSIDRNNAMNISRGKLSLAVCDNCGFIFNQTFDFSKLTYDENYDNTQDLSTLFDQHLSELIDELINQKKITNSCIVEIGCGKGSFLHRLVANEQWNNIGYGFDPTYVGPESLFDGKLKFIKKYYDSSFSDIPADVIICRHVIEHIPDPLHFLNTVKQALINSPNANLFFETPNVEWILTNNVIWDFFYEHCSYFSISSLSTVFQKAGFNIEAVKTVFNGQYVWLHATPNIQSITQNDSTHIPILAKRFAKLQKELTNHWMNKIHELVGTGKVALWGAGAKGVTFANMIDPNCKLIDSIIDINPNKQGKFIPGSGHPIIDPMAIISRNIKTVIIMNPNYYKENSELLKKANISVDVIT